MSLNIVGGFYMVLRRKPLGRENSRAPVNDLCRYRLIGKIGEGLWAEVFLVFDRLTQKRVALKVLHSHSQRSSPKAFPREIRALGSVKHENIVQLYDAGPDAGLALGAEPNERPYYTMEYIPGVRLTDRIKSGDLSIQDALSIAFQMAHGSSAVHELDLVHRDLKPDNVLLIEQENGSLLVKILDFGIILDLNDPSQREREVRGDIAAGEPLYMAPEQIIRGGIIDQRADIYALGAVLYEMLAGHPPFEAETVRRLFDKHLYDDVPSITSGVPEAVNMMLFRALSKEPDDRQVHMVQVMLEAKMCQFAL